MGGALFERLPTGVRLTPLGTVAAGRARHLLREIGSADETMAAVVCGRAGHFRVSATPMWMEAVLAPAAAAFRKLLPAVGLTLRTALFTEGLRLLEAGESDLHCGGPDPGQPLPAFLRRERFLDMTAGIVAHAGHPLLDGTPTIADLTEYPWIEFGTPSPDDMPALLFRETGRRVPTVMHAGAAGLSPMATGPWLARLPLDFLDRLTAPALRPLPTRFGCRRYRAGFVARRAAEDLAPFRLLEETVREVALESRGR